MTSSLPESVGDLFTFAQPYRNNKDEQIHIDTLWSKLNETDQCVFFRNMVAKALYAKDFNDVHAAVQTIFVPRNFRNRRNTQFVPSDFVSSLTIPGQLFILPENLPKNTKVQNKLKEFVSVNINDVKNGGQAFFQVFDRLWLVVVPNIMCTNGIIHLIDEYL